MKYQLLVVLLAGLLVGCGVNQQEADTDPVEPPTSEPDAVITEPALEQLPEGDSVADESEVRGRLASLSSSQIQQLLDVKFITPSIGAKSQGSVIIPTYIPLGFKVDTFITSYSWEVNPEIYYFYSIVYRGDNNSCFKIEGSAYDAQNIGDLPWEVETIEEINSPGLGMEVALGYTSFVQEYNSGLVVAQLFIKDGAATTYTFVSPVKDVCTEGISVQQAAKIVESLQYLDSQKSEKPELINDVMLQIK